MFIKFPNVYTFVKYECIKKLENVLKYTNGISY